MMVLSKQVVSALLNYSALIELVPEKYITKEIMVKAIIDNIKLLRKIPNHLNKQDVIFGCIDMSTNFFSRLPQELMTEDVVCYACKKLHTNIRYYPASLLNKKLVLDIVKNNGLCLLCLDDVFKTKEVIEVAQNDGETLINYVRDVINVN